MTYNEKKKLAEKVLRENGYSEEEIKEIIKRAFGKPPKS